jgi:hypothetical protein
MITERVAAIKPNVGTYQSHYFIDSHKSLVFKFQHLLVNALVKSA